MGIKKIAIQYFKGIEKLDIDLDGNCVIYGENGSGKSSVYEAMRCVFYRDKVAKELREDIEDYYKNRNFPAEFLKVDINFDDNNLILYENKLNSNELLDKYDYFFANEKILNRLTKENFYIAIRDTLSFYFNELSKIASNDSGLYLDFKNIDKKISNIRRYNLDITDKELRDKLNDELKEKKKQLNEMLETKIPLDDINNIIQEHFKEKFSISFEIDDNSAELVEQDVIEFKEPVIKIKINNINHKGKIYHHFNEAKIKIIALAIYFSLVKKYANKNKKILVLDDFLTSLDMANRKYIIEYILNNFKKFQIIIFTHNIHFFNLIQKIVSKNKLKFSFKKLFIFDNKINIYEHNTSFLEKAKQRLSEGNIEESANLCRKEFERICLEFEEILQIGRKQELQCILDELKSKKESLMCTVEIKKRIQELEKANSMDKLEKIKKQIDIYISVIDKYNEELKNIKIEQIEILKNILLNPASHNNTEQEFYQKDCSEAIELLKNLNNIKEKIK